MITVKEAQNLVIRSIGISETSEVALNAALLCTLAKDLKAPIPLPTFTNSAMDGYGVRYEDISSFKEIELRVVGEVKAGDFPEYKLKAGEAIRIFTGAPLPDGADTVIKEEDVISTTPTTIQVSARGLKKGDNVRLEGEEIKAGAVALKSGTLLTPPAIGFLSSLGIDKVPVYSRPKVRIITTGSELLQSGETLSKGHIYESNSKALKAACANIGIEPQGVTSVKDSLQELISAITLALSDADFILLSGGVSVGKYDLVRTALDSVGFREIFYKVAQKPGKPLLFGVVKTKERDIYIFGLPGNPAAALTCFYEYVYPALRKRMGAELPFLPKTNKTLLNDLTISLKPLSYFLKGKISEDGVLALPGQGSNILSSFAKADCIIYIEEGTAKINKGDEVEVHILPFCNGW